MAEPGAVIGGAGDRTDRTQRTDRAGRLSTMKVLFCTHEPFYPLSGGCTAGNWNIVRSLARRGHEVVVAAPLYVGPGPVERESGARIVPVAPFRMHRASSARMARYGLYTVFYRRAVSRLLRRESFDAILVRNAVLAWAARAARRRSRTPAVLSMTDFLTAFLREDPKYPRWLVRSLTGYEMRAATWFDRVVVITPRMRDELVRARPQLEGRVDVGYDGVDADRFDPARYSAGESKALRDRLGVSDRLVIYHGTIEPHHGEAVIHEILERLAAGNDCDVLVIAGGKGYEHLKERVRHARVRFMDFVPYEEMPAYLAAARVGIVPYPTNYGLDLVYTLKLLEYLSMNLPTVTFNLASVRDVFGGRPDVCVAEDVDGFVSGVRRFLDAPPGATPREAILERFTWERVTDVMERVLLEVAGGRQPGPLHSA